MIKYLHTIGVHLIKESGVHRSIMNSYFCSFIAGIAIGLCAAAIVLGISAILIFAP